MISMHAKETQGNIVECCPKYRGMSLDVSETTQSGQSSESAKHLTFPIHRRRDVHDL